MGSSEGELTLYLYLVGSPCFSPALARYRQGAAAEGPPCLIPTGNSSAPEMVSSYQASRSLLMGTETPVTGNGILNSACYILNGGR